MEGRLGFVFLVDRNLPIAGLEVQGGEEPGNVEGLQGVFDERQGMGVFHYHVIKAP